MAVETSLEARIREWEERLARSVDGHPPLTLTPAWWQERLLQWATTRSRVSREAAALRGRTADAAQRPRPSPTTCGSTSESSAPGIVHTASGLASQSCSGPSSRGWCGRASSRWRDGFIAGETPEDAVPVVRDWRRTASLSRSTCWARRRLSDAEADAYLARYLALIETLSRTSRMSRPKGAALGWRAGRQHLDQALGALRAP